MSVKLNWCIRVFSLIFCIAAPALLERAFKETKMCMSKLNWVCPNKLTNGSCQIIISSPIPNHEDPSLHLYQGKLYSGGVQLLKIQFALDNLTWTNMYLPSTSKVCDEKGPRVVSKILTHFFASVCEQGGNLMCFSNEVSERGDKIEKNQINFCLYPLSLLNQKRYT